jgi:endonuclease YncB( thermonuclease family)
MYMKVLLGLVICSLGLNLIFFIQNYNRTRVTAVPDGDSIQLADGRRVRLLGIDAPELGRCMAAEAKEKLRSLVFSKHVMLKDMVTDDYGRVLAIVSVWPNVSVNEIMLAAGLARYTGSAPTLKPAADLAKARQIGIYTCRTQPTRDCLIKGNVRAGDKIYHLPAQAGMPGCDNYAQVIVDEAYGDHWFCTEAEAVAAGFTKASGCR